MLLRTTKNNIAIFRNYSKNNYALLNEAREKFKILGGGKINLEKDERTGIACVTLDNPEKKNALTGSMMAQLESIVNDLECWVTGKGVILTAKGDFFCSGGDISSNCKSLSTPEDGLLMATFMHHTLTRLFSLPLISVTLLNGKAIGGGAELTTTTDFRLFSENADVSFVHGRMGIATGWGGGTRLVNLLGPTLTLDLLLTCRKLTADEALKIGFADHVLRSANILSEAKEWLNKRLTHHYSVLQAMKKIVVGARDLSFEESLLNERETFSPLWGGPVNLEALNKRIKHK